MNRRGFLGGLVATAAGLWLPHEPERVYSFIREPAFPKLQPMLRIYGGAAPLNADAALSHLMLSEVPLSFKDGKWKGADFAADNTGTVSFARLYGATGEALIDIPCDALGLNSPYVTLGSQLSMQMVLDKKLATLMV